MVLLDSFIDRIIKKEKMINEIQKMIFDQHFYARFLKGYNFDTSMATQMLKNYLEWRKKQYIETILVSDILKLIFDISGLRVHAVRKDKGAHAQWVPRN
jgi:hypothetical protein